MLSPIESNEPVLSVKITGAGQRATLSALVGDGMKAVSVRVNDVEGVGGFVLPGDRVDVVLTRQMDKGNATTEVVLQNARVLAVDQSADDRTTKAAVAKAVTLEVDTVGAQKIWLAASVGSLSLLLAQGRRAELRAHAPRHARRSQQAGQRQAGKERRRSTTISVQRGGQSTELQRAGRGHEQGSACVRGDESQGPVTGTPEGWGECREEQD